MTNANNQNAAFPRLLAKHDPSIRAFVRATIPRESDVAEVMQNVSVIAWQKFSELQDPETEFGSWACVIAKYEILKFRRGKARDRLVLDTDIVEQLADEGIEEAGARAQWLVALEGCLTKLPDAKRTLLLRAYDTDTSIQDLAIELGKKPNALYQLFSRLRSNLANCIERKIMEGAD